MAKTDGPDEEGTCSTAVERPLEKKVELKLQCRSSQCFFDVGVRDGEATGRYRWGATCKQRHDIARASHNKYDTGS